MRRALAVLVVLLSIGHPHPSTQVSPLPVEAQSPFATAVVWASGNQAVAAAGRYAVWQRAAWIAAAHRPEPARAAVVQQSTQVVATAGSCGGDLPPCWIVARESHGDIRVWNGGCYEPYAWRGPPCGASDASGKYQFLRTTWGTRADEHGVVHAGYGGYWNAADAPESVQDDWARQVWASTRGCAWSACW